MKIKMLSSSILPLMFSLMVSPMSKSSFGTSMSSSMRQESVRTDIKRIQNISSLPELTETDENIKAELIKSSYNDVSQSFSLHFQGDIRVMTTNYIFGYFGAGSDALPLTAVYDVTCVDGTKETREKEFDLMSPTNPFDAIGRNVGSEAIDVNVDIHLDVGERVDVNSLVVANIYEAKQENGAWVPNREKGFKISYDHFDKTGVKNYGLSDYLITTLDHVSSFAGYSAFKVSINNKFDELYKVEKPSIYRRHSKAIEAGEEYFYYLFPSLVNAYFQLVYDDGTIIESAIMASSISSLFPIKGGSAQYCFTIKNVPINNLKAFYICGLDYSVKLFYTATKKGVTGTELNTRFSRISFVSEKGDMSKVPHTNINLVMILVSLIFTLAMAGIEIGLYFYRKKKYRNDEFKRVNTRNYIKTGVITYLSLGVLLLDILFIVFRGGLFNNTFTVFNPLDNFIVVLSILCIFAIGYFAKFFISYFKDRKARREAQKLKLDNDISDDGTK